MQETSGKLGGTFTINENNVYSIAIRTGMFSGFWRKWGRDGETGNGAAYNYVTFRPAVWN